MGNALQTAIESIKKGDKEELMLDLENLNADQVKQIVDELKANTTVKKLSLGANNFGAEGCQHIAELIRVNRALTTIDIGQNLISPESREALETALEGNEVLLNLIMDCPSPKIRALIRRNREKAHVEIEDPAPQLGNLEFFAQAADGSNPASSETFNALFSGGVSQEQLKAAHEECDRERRRADNLQKKINEFARIVSDNAQRFHALMRPEVAGAQRARGLVEAGHALDMYHPFSRVSLWLDRSGRPHEFVAVGKKNGGQAAGAMFNRKVEKATEAPRSHDRAAQPPLWLGKVDAQDRLPVREVLAYHILYSFGVAIPKCALVKQPTVNEFNNNGVALQNAQPMGAPPRPVAVWVMSRWIDGYQNLGMPFVDHIVTLGRPPEEVIVEGEKVPLCGTMRALAVGKFIGDCDFIGGSGENAGFVLRPTPAGERRVVDFVKIDPGEAFNFTQTSTIEQRKNLTYSKDVSVGNNLTKNVVFTMLTPAQHDEFIDGILSIVTTDKDTWPRLVGRAGISASLGQTPRMSGDQVEWDPIVGVDADQETLLAHLVGRRDLMLQIYRDDLREYLGRASHCAHATDLVLSLCKQHLRPLSAAPPPAAAAPPPAAAASADGPAAAAQAGAAAPAVAGPVGDPVMCPIQ